MDGNELKVLLIEDSESEAFLILRELKHHWPNLACKRIDTEPDLLEALGEDWDIILSDYNMPLMNGIESLTITRNKGIDTPFILVSGSVGEDVAVSAMRLGANDYIMKDNLRRLAPAIERELEEHAMRRDLQFAEDKLRMQSLITRLTRNMVVITDADGYTEWVNDAFVNLTGYSLEEIKGKKPGHLLQGAGTDEETIRYLKDRIQKAEPFDCEILNYTREGKKYWVALAGQPVFDTNGEVINFFAIQTDITDKKDFQQRILEVNEELEERVITRTAELEAVNKDLERFNFVLSHDIRSSVHVIKICQEFLAKKVAARLNEDERGFLENIGMSVNAINSLIAGLMKIYKLTNNAISLDEVDISAIVNEAVDAQKLIWSGHNLDVSVNSLPVIATDGRLIHEVFHNLISNAFKYSSHKDTIEVQIGYENKGDSHLFFVKDNGAGFSMEYYDRLFSFFSRLHENSKFQGAGIGLAGAKRIIDRLNGTIWAKSEVNNGTTFYFTLPKTEELQPLAVSTRQNDKAV